MAVINVTGHDFHAGKMTIAAVERQLRKDQREYKALLKSGTFQYTAKQNLLNDKISAFQRRLTIYHTDDCYRWAGLLNKAQQREELA